MPPSLREPRRTLVAVVAPAPIADTGGGPDLDLDPVPQHIHHPGTAVLAVPVPVTYQLGAPTTDLVEHWVNSP
jgi:hypothetical protein